MVDDFLREIKKVMLQSFPNINKQAAISSDELNNLRAYMKRNGTAWDIQNSPLINVAASDNSTAAQPRSYNDGRYLQRTNNLSDVTNRNVAVNNLFSGIDTGSAGYITFRNLLNDAAWPVGSIYMNGSRGNNPRDWLGIGTWAQFAPGRVIVGAGSTTDSRGEGRNYGLGAEGGEFQHQLTEAEMPSHNHVSHMQQGTASPEGQGDWTAFGRAGGATSVATDYRGGNGAHNNMQPFRVCMVWIRTA